MVEILGEEKNLEGLPNLFWIMHPLLPSWLRYTKEMLNVSPCYIS